MSVSVFAPAKVNLTLEVGAPLASGRHPLASLVMFADIGDVVSARHADALTLTTRGPFAAALADEPDNLVLRAARLLAYETGLHDRGAALQLEKNLPVASGIGGGSADAAAALHALNTLWDLSLSVDDLAALAARLGADVPACVIARTGFMSGTGEAFAPIEAPAMPVVLANVGAPIATADAYRAFDARALGRPDLTSAPPALYDPQALLAHCKRIGNDLEDVACALAPDIAAARAALSAGEGVLYAALSGSGGTWFALPDSADHATDLAERLARAHPHWWVKAGRLGAPSR